MKILTERQLQRLLGIARQEGFDTGIIKGYELGWRMKKIGEANLGFTIGSTIDQQIQEILEKEK